jgi:hypothetical protein
MSPRQAGDPTLIEATLQLRRSQATADDLSNPGGGRQLLYQLTELPKLVGC